MTDLTQPPRLRFASAHITGIGERDANQDALGQRAAAGLSCFVVADGAGGHEGGATAARIVVDSVLTAFAARPEFDCAALAAWAGSAAVEVARAKATQPALASMHSTLAVLLLDETSAQACWAHVGDTRIYLFRAGQVRHMTRDHSLAQQIIDAGLGASNDPRLHAQRSVLYAAIGTDGESGLATQAPLALLPGDALLVCTDGLWEGVTEAGMEACLARAANVDAWLASLCAEAEAAAATSGHARDNFTAYALWIAA